MKKTKTKITSSITKDSNLCKDASNEILLHTSPRLLSKYKKHISSNIVKFIKNHKTKLNQALALKRNPKLSTQVFNNARINRVSYLALSPPINSQTSPTNQATENEHLLTRYTDESRKYTIPPFIDIFKFLFNHSSISKHFTPQELQDASRILSLPTHHEIYTNLHSNPVGNKLADIYAKQSNQINLTSRFPTTDFHSLLFNSFTSFAILEEIETTMHNVGIYSLQTSTRTYPNFLYIFDSIQSTNQATTEHNKSVMLEYANLAILVSKLAARIIFLGQLLGTDKLPNRIIIFLTKAKKEIDDSLELQAHFRTLNINTAVTNMQDIIIYREEELLKSIFHELIHFHNLDYKVLDPTTRELLLDYLHRTHNIAADNEYLVYEAITESMANLLNVIFSSSSLEDIARKLEDEILFSTYQVYKILHVCKYRSWDEFTLQNGATDNPNKHWKQDSCVFSYYVLKLYILLHLDEYWRDVLDSHLKFHPSITNFKKLINIFEKGRRDPILRKIINALLTSRTNIKSRSSKKTIKTSKPKRRGISINKTLRMTCLAN